MAGARTRRAAIQVRTRALVVRRVNVGEADVMLTLVTRSHGLVSASARSARRGTSKLGPLEPMHTLEVGLSVSAGVDVARLTDAKIVTARVALIEDPLRLDTAARVLGWARALVPAESAEPRGFDVIEGFLDSLVDVSLDALDALVVRGGLRILDAFGFGLELSSCVSCGTLCPDRASACVDAGRGGLVCRACGGGADVLTAVARAKLARAAAGERVELDADEIAVGTRLVEGALSIACGRGATRLGASQSTRPSRRT